jgi:hypothetical protein
MGKENKPDYKFESDYWGNCVNTLDEDLKQFLYAKAMGISKYNEFEFTVGGKRILDIGGGPTSLLLKTRDHGGSKVVDPIKYPQWTVDRYTSHNIEYDQKTGEEVNETGYDEVWIYNCLQHVIDPKLIIENAKKAAPVLRIFEWIDIPAHEGHPHELKEDLLNEWIGGRGSTSYITLSNVLPTLDSKLLVFNDQNIGGRSYFGSFNTNKN